MFLPKVVTIDANESITEAIAIKYGRILAVGSNEQIKSLIGSETEVIDLKGRTMIPGLLESHCHISTAEGLQQAMGVIDASHEGGGEDGVPIPDTRERTIETEDKQVIRKNCDGLEMIFELAAQGKPDRDIAITLNSLGFKTTGTHGPRFFQKTPSNQ